MAAHARTNGIPRGRSSSSWNRPEDAMIGRPLIGDYSESSELPV